MLQFFNKQRNQRSSAVLAGAPTPTEQLMAINNNEYWTILNSRILRFHTQDPLLRLRVNAFKQALQTFGPTGNQLPDFRTNKGDARNSVFHGHLTNATGTTFVLEWEMVNPKKRIMRLVGFDVHENYSFKTKAMTEEECTTLMTSRETIDTLENVALKVGEAKDKVERIERNYRHCSGAVLV